MRFSFKTFLLMQGAFTNVGMVARRLLGKIFRNPLPLLIPGFNDLSPFRRHFLQNLLTGVVIEILIILASVLHFGPVVDNQNAALDWMMRLSANISTSDSKRPNQVWIDVDERTYRSRQWGGGEPAILPLEPLAKLIEYALEKEARYVVVDFTIDGAGNEHQEQFKQRMQTLLLKYQKAHLLFMRTIRTPLDPTRLTSRSVRPSVLDDLIADNPKRVHAAAPNFQVSGDNVLRHWKLWESACLQVPGGTEGEGRWVVLPSPQIIVAALMQQERGKLPPSLPPWSLAMDKEAMKGVAVCAMDGLEDEEVLNHAQDSRMADFGAGRWVYNNFGVCYQQDRVTHADCESGFSLAAMKNPSERQQEVKPAMALGNRVYFRLSETAPLPTGVQRLPAHYILASSPGNKVATIRSGQKNLVAVIGSSYTDSRDFHLTPLGKIPGALVLINSIDSLCTAGILQSPKSWQKLLVFFVILVAVSAIFAWLPSFWAATVMMAGIVCLMVPVSFWLFMEQGVWLDFAAPIIGIYFHREWEDLQEQLSSCLPDKTTGESS